MLRDVIAAASALAKMDIRHHTRRKPIARIRLAAYAVAREACRASYPQIAKAFGRTDHTTALYGARNAPPELVEAVYERAALIAGVRLASPEWTFEWMGNG